MPVTRASGPQDGHRSQGPWDRRDVAELSHTTFRTALFGFDRDQVSALLTRVANDYRVLQMQNASLKRQLANLEAALRAAPQRAESAPLEAPVPDRPSAPPADPPAVRERDANGIRIVARTFDHTLKKLDAALVAVPALKND
jgi:cell division septum initiation protein DivIVA